MSVSQSGSQSDGQPGREDKSGGRGGDVATVPISRPNQTSNPQPWRESSFGDFVRARLQESLHSPANARNEHLSAGSAPGLLDAKVIHDSLASPSINSRADGQTNRTGDSENQGKLKNKAESGRYKTLHTSRRVKVSDSIQQSTTPGQSTLRSSSMTPQSQNPHGQNNIEASFSKLSIKDQSKTHSKTLQISKKRLKAPYATSPDLVLSVPVPTKEYLVQAMNTPQKSSSSQRLLIVIDLNGTLLCRTNTRASFKRRQNVAAFLAHLLEHHYVMIWSSSTPQNVQKMTNQLFDEQQREILVAQWGRDTLRLTPPQFKNKVQVYKQLSWIWEPEAPIKHPKDIVWDQKNTVLLDDSIAKAAAEPHNLLQVPEFEGFEEQIDVLGQALGFINWLKDFADVSSAICSKPFKADGDWSWDWKSDKVLDSMP
jgi:NLI interacting factor-like phosphatase